MNPAGSALAHAFALALLATTTAAQTAPCHALNDQNTSVNPGITGYAFTGPGVWGFQISLITPQIARALRIFTGNTALTPGFMTLELWSNDPTTNLPLARLGGGTWRIWPSLANSWQGANLDAVVLMLPNTPYWIVWIEPGWCTIPYEPGGTPIPSAKRSGSTWAAGAAAALKYRVFCALLDGVNATPHGLPCASSLGQLGGEFTNHEPKTGNADFSYEASGFPVNAPCVLLLGGNPGWNPLPVPGLPPGCLLNTDILLSFSGQTGTGDVRANATTVGAAGHVTFQLPIPGNSGLVGVFLAGQVAAVDTGSSAPVPLAVSNALRIKIY